MKKVQALLRVVGIGRDEAGQAGCLQLIVQLKSLLSVAVALALRGLIRVVRLSVAC